MSIKISTFGLLIALHANVFADSASWINSGGGNWSVDANWNASYPNSSSDVATFPNISEFSPITVTVDEVFSVASLVFTDTSNSEGYYLNSSGGGLLNLYDSISVSTNQSFSSRIDSPLVLQNTIIVSATSGSGLEFTTGGISGSGGITLTGLGMLSFGTATNTYSGTTTINSGTFQAGQTNVFSPNSAFVMGDSPDAILDVNAGSNTIKSLSGGGSSGGNVLIGAGNTLTLGDDTPSLTYSGQIQDEFGAGAILKQGSGEWILNGSNSYSGGTTLNAGQITLGNNTAIGLGPLTMADNTTLGLNNGITSSNELTLSDSANISVDSGTGTLSGSIEGSGGSIVKIGLGALILNGNNTYTGTTIVAQGSLSMNGSSSSGLSISSGAILKGTGTFNSITLENGAILAPGNSVGTITTSSVLFDSGSIFQVEINPSEASSLIVTSAATLGGNVKVDPDAGFYGKQGQYLILDAGSISGAFDPTVLGGLRGYTFNLNQIENSLYLFYNIDLIPMEELSGNALKVAKHLNDYADAESLLRLNTLSGNTLSQAMNSISPARNAFANYITEQTAFSLSNLLSSHIDSSRFMQKETFENSFTAMLTADSSDGLTLQKEKAKNPISTWVSGFGEFAHQSAYLQNPSFNYISGAALAGLDYRANNSWILGGTLGYVHTHFYEGDHAGHGNINGYFTSLYANAFAGSFYFSPALWGVFNETHNTRSISFPGYSENAHANIFAWQLIPHLEVGYQFAFNWGTIDPFTSADWALSWQRSYQEHGASPFNAKQKESNSSMVRSETGLKFFEKWNKNWGAFLLKEKVSYVFEKPYGTGTVNTSFVGTPSSFTVTAVNQNLNLGSVGLNFVTVIGKQKPIKIDLGYEGEFGSNYWASDLMLTLSKSF